MDSFLFSPAARDARGFFFDSPFGRIDLLAADELPDAADLPSDAPWWLATLRPGQSEAAEPTQEPVTSDATPESDAEPAAFDTLNTPAEGEGDAVTPTADATTDEPAVESVRIDFFTADELPGTADLPSDSPWWLRTLRRGQSEAVEPEEDPAIFDTAPAEAQPDAVDPVQDAAPWWMRGLMAVTLDVAPDFG